MKIRSMTGFGKSVSAYGEKKVVAEVRSLNSKGLDLNLRLPYVYKEKELELRSAAGKVVERGKVDISVYIESQQEAVSGILNTRLAKAFHAELKTLSQELNEPATDLLPLVLRMPEVLKADKEQAEPDEEEWKIIQQTLEGALGAFQKFRDDEGATLAKEFLARIELIASLLQEVVALDGLRIGNVKERIRNNLHEVFDREKVDENRFEQELIYYIEKLDITEEKLRLKTHLDYFTATMDEAGSGRKLGFIAQEIGREINTIGSKANDAAIQKLVVRMKDELEKIKEQLLNVL